MAKDEKTNTASGAPTVTAPQVTSVPGPTESSATFPAASNTEPPANFEMHVDEFCLRLSAKDKRVELIHGFHHFVTYVEKKVKDFEAGFQERFKAFAERPVK